MGALPMALSLLSMMVAYSMAFLAQFFIAAANTLPLMSRKCSMSCNSKIADLKMDGGRIGRSIVMAP